MTTLNWPGFGLASISPTLDQPSQSNSSAWTGTRTVITDPWHGKWSFKVTLATRQGDAAFQAARAFFTSLKGQIGTFHLPAVEAAQNGNTGVTLSANAAQGATSIALTGVTTALVAGNMVTIAGQLLSLTSVGSLSGSAQTVNFMPTLRAAHLSGVAVETAKPYALVYLSDSSFTWDIGSWRRYGLSFSATEAVNETDGADPLLDVWTGDTGSSGGTSLFSFPTLPSFITRSLLAAVTSPSDKQVAYLTEAGREGTFVFSTANLSTNVTADTAQGIYVAPAADTTGSSGAWVRKFSGLADIRWFGAVADCTGIGVGTDNAAAINAAKAVAAIDKCSAVLVPKAPLGFAYRVASTIVHTQGIKLVGEGWHQNPGTVGVTSYSGSQLYRGSVLVFDANVKGMEFFAFTDNAANATAFEYESSTFSILEDIMLYGGGGTTATAHGIQVHVEVRMRNVRIDNFPGDGLHINADTAGANTYGQASLSQFANGETRGNGCHGVYVAGGDSNVIHFDGWDSAENGGVGFLDISTLGNGYSAIHAASNNQSYGASSAQRTRVTGDWAGLSDQLAGSIVTTSVNAQHVFDAACYSEGGNGGKAEILAPAIILGGVLSGDAAHTANSNALRFNGGKIKNVDEIRARTTSLEISKGVLDLTDDQAYAGPSVGARLQYSSVTGLGLAGVGSSYDLNARNAAQVSVLLVAHNSGDVQHPVSLSIGGGTPLTNAVVYAPSITPASVAAATVAEQTFTVSDLTTADKVIVNPPAIANATGIAGARVSATNTLAIRFINPTAGALSPTSGTYTVLAFRS